MASNRRLIARRISISISIIAFVIGIGSFIVLRQWNLFIKISLGIFLIGLAVYVALDPDAIRNAFSGRQARHGSNAVILSLAFIGILVLINFLVYKNTKRWDLTVDQSNTLAQETLDLLKNLPDTVIAKAYFTSDESVAAVKESSKNLLDKFIYASDGKFQYEFIDPIKDPVSAQEAGITKDGSIVLYMGSNKQPVTLVSEQELTGAMIRLLNPDKHVIYFLTGHGEFLLDDTSDQSFSQLKTLLANKNYTVSSLNLLSTNIIPDDASVIVVAGPQKPLADNEVNLLDTYMKNGGSLLVMEEPPVVTLFGDSPDPLADFLAQAYGILLGNDIVVDLQAAQSIQEPFIAIANQYAQHPITQKMGEMATFYPTARSVMTGDTVNSDISTTSLVMTADQSWAEEDMATVKDGSMQPDEGVDAFGPITLAVTGSATGNKSRLVVFGDSDFATNAYINNYGNGDMIVNSIDWAANVENIISLTPKKTVERYLVQPKPYTVGLILLGSLVVLPGIVLAAGIGTWLARRKQG